MRLSVISFTENGKQLSEKVAAIFDQEMEVRLYTKCKACMDEAADTFVVSVKISLRDWTKEQMQKRNALLFIGACAIAVRAIAPFLYDKRKDAPVLVMDEMGHYVIPILSGHIGGANELADRIAAKMGAEPVITTATDIRKKFAIDLFAKKNGLFIQQKEGIALVSAKVLAQKGITMSIEPGHGIDETTCLPQDIRLVPYPPKKKVEVVITSEDCRFDTALLLKPREYIIGMGCKKGRSAEEIGSFIARIITEIGICASQVFALASIAQKREEQGMLEWCQKEAVLFFTYTPEELQEVQGTFTESAFVRAQVGVGNVCERAALKACGEGGVLIVSKHAENGITIAVAKREWKVRFYDK